MQLDRPPIDQFELTAVDGIRYGLPFVQAAWLRYRPDNSILWHLEVVLLSPEKLASVENWLNELVQRFPMYAPQGAEFTTTGEVPPGLPARIFIRG